MFRRSAASHYTGRAAGVGALLRADSTLLRIIIFAAMSAIFFLFLKMTERKIPRGIAPDSTYGRSIDTSRTGTEK